MLQLPKLIPALSQGCCPGATFFVWGCSYFMFLCLIILKCSLDIVNDAPWRFGISSQALNDYQYSNFFFLSSDKVTWKFLLALAKWLGVCFAHAWYRDWAAFPHAWYRDQAASVCSDLWYFPCVSVFSLGFPSSLSSCCYVPGPSSWLLHRKPAGFSLRWSPSCWLGQLLILKPFIRVSASCSFSLCLQLLSRVFQPFLLLSFNYFI